MKAGVQRVNAPVLTERSPKDRLAANPKPLSDKERRRRKRKGRAVDAGVDAIQPSEP